MVDERLDQAMRGIADFFREVADLSTEQKEAAFGMVDPKLAAQTYGIMTDLADANRTPVADDRTDEDDFWEEPEWVKSVGEGLYRPIAREEVREVVLINNS